LCNEENEKGVRDLERHKYGTHAKGQSEESSKTKIKY
jgi:hypothetical protein